MVSRGRTAHRSAPPLDEGDRLLGHLVEDITIFIVSRGRLVFFVRIGGEPSVADIDVGLPSEVGTGPKEFVEAVVQGAVQYPGVKVDAPVHLSDRFNVRPSGEFHA